MKNDKKRRYNLRKFTEMKINNFTHKENVGISFEFLWTKVTPSKILNIKKVDFRFSLSVFHIFRLNNVKFLNIRKEKLWFIERRKMM